MSIKFLSALLACAALTTLSACTTRAWYESTSAAARNDCNRMQPGAREDCLAKVNKTPYDTYEKERAEQK
jgi:hypothetical protein